MANFKTAYLQREIIEDLAVKATVQTDPAAGMATRKTTPASLVVVMVGDLVKLTPATATVPAYIERVISKATATHIVAQSDMTLEYGHVPVENRDYRYLPIVNGTAASVVAATPVKKVALFKITDPTDVNIEASKGETV